MINNNFIYQPTFFMEKNKKQPKATLIIRDPKTGQEVAREVVDDAELAHLVPGEEYLLIVESVKKK